MPFTSLCFGQHFLTSLYSFLYGSLKVKGRFWKVIQLINKQKSYNLYDFCRFNTDGKQEYNYYRRRPALMADPIGCGMLYLGRTFTGHLLFGYELFPKSGIDNRWNVKLCYSAIVCAAQGVVFSSVRSIYFNLKNNTFKKEYSVGPIRVGNWKKLPNVAYVSVFRQLKKDGSHTYEVNLWLKGNKSFTVYESSHMESTFALGKNAARSLKVDLLDARVPNDYKWIHSPY